MRRLTNGFEQPVVSVQKWKFDYFVPVFGRSSGPHKSPSMLRLGSTVWRASAWGKVVFLFSQTSKWSFVRKLNGLENWKQKYHQKTHTKWTMLCSCTRPAWSTDIFAFLTENPVIWSALAPKRKTKLTTAHSTKKNSPQQGGEKVMAYVRIPLLKRHLETVEYFDGRGGKNTHLWACAIGTIS